MEENIPWSPLRTSAHRWKGNMSFNPEANWCKTIWDWTRPGFNLLLSTPVPHAPITMLCLNQTQPSSPRRIVASCSMNTRQLASLPVLEANSLTVCQHVVFHFANLISVLLLQTTCSEPHTLCSASLPLRRQEIFLEPRTHLLANSEPLAIPGQQLSAPTNLPSPCLTSCAVC